MTQKAACLRPYSVYNHIYDAAARERGLKFVFDALANGAIKPCVDRVYELQDFREAFLYQLESANRRGKIVISTRG